MDFIFNNNNLDLDNKVKYRTFWSLAMYFDLPICKVCFIDVSNIEL